MVRLLSVNMKKPGGHPRRQQLRSTAILTVGNVVSTRSRMVVDSRGQGLKRVSSSFPSSFVTLGY